MKNLVLLGALVFLVASQSTAFGAQVNTEECLAFAESNSRLNLKSLPAKQVKKTKKSKVRSN